MPLCLMRAAITTGNEEIIWILMGYINSGEKKTFLLRKPDGRRSASTSGEGREDSSAGAGGDQCDHEQAFR